MVRCGRGLRRRKRDLKHVMPVCTYQEGHFGGFPSSRKLHVELIAASVQALMLS